MKRVTYLRLAAVFPLLPLAALPLLSSGAVVDDFLQGILGVLVMSVLIGGIPYAGAAGLSLYLLRSKSPEAHWRLARWAPLIYVPLFGVALFASGQVVKPSTALRDLLAIPFLSAVYAIYVLPVGYLYVLLAWLGYRSLERLGSFEDAAQQGNEADRPPLTGLQ